MFAAFFKKSGKEILMEKVEEKWVELEEEKKKMAKLEKEKKEEEKKLNKWILIRKFHLLYQDFCKKWIFFCHILKLEFLICLIKGLNCVDIAEIEGNISKYCIYGWFSSFLEVLY